MHPHVWTCPYGVAGTGGTADGRTVGTAVTATGRVKTTKSQSANVFGRVTDGRGWGHPRWVWASSMARSVDSAGDKSPTFCTGRRWSRRTTERSRRELKLRVGVMPDWR